MEHSIIQLFPGGWKSLRLLNAASEFHVFIKLFGLPLQVKYMLMTNYFILLQNDNSIPFNKDFFEIFNVAGTFGGAIDPAFYSIFNGLIM
jgi:hypothetical protein